MFSRMLRRGLSFGHLGASHKLQKGPRRRQHSSVARPAWRTFEHLESRWVLSSNPVLNAAADQVINENQLLDVSSIGSFSDVAELEGVFSGLDPRDFASLGNFHASEDSDPDPDNPGSFIPSVVINTDTLTVSGLDGITGLGQPVTADVGYGAYQIAVFTFTNVEIESGVVVRITGSRPVALLSHGNLTIDGAIDVSARPTTPTETGTPGAGGGAGGDSVAPLNGDPAAGAPATGAGAPGSGRSGSGGGFGGAGGRGSMAGMIGGNPGDPYANLRVGIQGGSGGSASADGANIEGGGGGGGIELGAVGVVKITGAVFADGAAGEDGSAPNNGGGGGGGAGGGIFIHGTSVQQDGFLSARGGNGGDDGLDAFTNPGGGGGGGEILIVHSSVGSYSGSGGYDVSGGTSDANIDRAGEAGNFEVIAESPVQYEIDWGDSSPNTLGIIDFDSPATPIGSVFGGVFDGSHVYADNDQYIVTVTTTDAAGHTATDTLNVTVNNLTPTLSLGKSTVRAAGGVFHNSGTAKDVPADTVTVTASVGSIALDDFGVWQWTYAPAVGTELPSTVTITAADEDGASTHVTFSLAASAGSPDPVLEAIANQFADEGVTLDISDLLSFSDVSQAPADTTGLNAMDYASLGAFSPSAGATVIIDTDALTISGGGFSGAGAVELAEIDGRAYEIAVFTFSSFQLDAGETIIAKGSRPLALLSQGAMTIAGTIDVSATGDGIQGNGQRIAGAGGGNGGLGSDSFVISSGHAAAGAPSNSVGNPVTLSSGGGTGGGFGGNGGRSEGQGSSFPAATGLVGVAYANLQAGIQGGSGGGTAKSGSDRGEGPIVSGGGGGGGIELGASGILTVATTGKVLANGGQGSDNLSSGSDRGAGGGGAGGGILLHAATVNHYGELSAKGGDGGEGARDGGGGGGGAILIVHSSSGAYDNDLDNDGLADGTHSVAGGLSPAPINATQHGVAGQFNIQSETGLPTSGVETYTYHINWGDGQTSSGDATVDVPAADNGGVALGSFDASHAYADDNHEPYVVTVTVADSGGGSHTQSFTVTVSNVAPTVTEQPPSITVNEGQTAASSGAFADVPADPLTITASIGTVEYANGAWTWSHHTADGPAGPQTVTITADDGDGGVTVAEFDLTVNNVAPTVAVDNASVAVNEGHSASNTGTFADVPADVVAITASIGAIIVDEETGAWTWSYTAGDGPDSQTVTITADDGDGGIAVASFDLTVNNVAPSVSADSASVTVNEGQIAVNSGTFGDVVDPVTLSASWGTIFDNGDGTWQWTYAAADGPGGPQAVTVTADDGDGGVAIATFDVTVNNVAPTLIISGDATVDEGAEYTLNFSATDPGADTITQWAVNWGDGQVEILSGNPSAATHTYADGSNNYVISATATDEDGSYATNTLAVTVANVAPTLAVSGNAAVNEGAEYTLNLSATDPGADAVFEWVVNWGDGNVETIAGNPALATHAYADGDNLYAISATAKDEDGQYTAASIDVAVANVAPTLVISGDSTVNEAAAYTLNLSASDPGADAIAGWVINWGDGSTPEAITGNPASASHTYADGNAGSTYMIIATATDEDGSYSSNSLAVTVNNVDPTADAGSGYVTFDDTAVTLTGTGIDVAGAEDPLSYAWDLDNDGTFETAGQTVNFTPEAFGIVGTQVRTVKFQVTDGDGGVAVDETTVQIIGEGTLLLDGVLYIVGDRTASDLVLVTELFGDIHVLATYDNNVPSAFSEADVTEIVVRTRGGSDVFVATSNVDKPMSIDGGDGNDFLKGGGGDNVILGGAGHDTLYGSGGVDRLFGGLGDDDLLGFGGDDVLVGGDGRDIVNGGDGRDLLIGGCNEDLLHGGTSEDILIGGYTSHDDDLAALDSIMAIWGSADSFNDRVEALTTAGGLLVAGATVFDDDAADHVIGAAGRDLAFADTSKNWDGVKDTASLSPAQDTLISLN